MPMVTEEWLKQILDQQFTTFYGHIIRHMDTRFDAQQTYMDRRFDDVYRKLDAMTKRQDDHELEQAAIKLDQKRQRAWINQLAQNTHTRLPTE